MQARDRKGDMTLTPERQLIWGMGANGGEYYLYAIWDDRQCDENGENCLDPNADMLIRQLRYKNMSAVNKRIMITDNPSGQIRVYEAPAGTPDTTIVIPTGQRFRVDTEWRMG